MRTMSKFKPTLSRAKVGMASLIFMESALFSAFLVTYLYYIGKSPTGPQPMDCLELGLVTINSICLFASSATVVFAVRALSRGSLKGFQVWMLLTILLGLEFLVGTGLEWKKLIEVQGLTIDSNVFGTTFYTLVGFHAFHVIVGLVLLTGTFMLALCGCIKPERDTERVEIATWYWHFVDVVWIVVFTLVYFVGKVPQEALS
ncbi:MAG: heme-copper oxidase subunit III [Planctomycetota bacterium]|jgi:cytochrome c oxidase subunit III|nr:MAG: heme-copper oxidase subunit III [Planctomycetota bacterium]